jgi:hypothetical protein
MQKSLSKKKVGLQVHIDPSALGLEFVGHIEQVDVADFTNPKLSLHY